MNVAGNVTDRVNVQNPWPGLAAYEEADQHFFQGRDDESVELFRLVKRELLTTLYGQSGLGKTSLLQAGLFPRLREADFLPVYVRLEHDETAPPLAAQVLAALAVECGKNRIEAVAPLPGDTFWEYFHRSGTDFWNTRNRLVTPVLIFDQFEELFTLGRASVARRERGRQFLVELADLVEMRVPQSVTEKAAFRSAENFNFERPGCKVLLSLREDFLPDLESLRPLMRSLIHNRQRIECMKGPRALDVILTPGAHLVSNNVAHAIVRFVSAPRDSGDGELEHAEVEPSLLSLVCRELNNRRLKLNLAQITTDLLAGSHKEIVAEFYERSLEGQPPRARQFIEDRLLTRSGFRDSVALDDIELPRTTIDLLVKRRLLRLDERLGVQRVELTHDVLLAPIKASRDQRREREAKEKAEREAREAREREEAARAEQEKLRQLMKKLEDALSAQTSATFEAVCANALLYARDDEDVKVVDALAPYLQRAELKSHAKHDEAQRLFDRAQQHIQINQAACDDLRAHAKAVSLYIGKDVVLDLVRIPAGTFLMGSPEDEAERSDDEKQHPVSITMPFYIGTYAVTQAQYEAVTARNPSAFKGKTNPVETVSWENATEFCTTLSERLKSVLPDGTCIQLPTEAQWEYACRAGTKTRFYSGDECSDLDKVAWYGPNSESKTHPVGEKASNAFGLYDMHGNVYEWCQDAYLNEYETLQPNDPFNAQGADRLLRGGSWDGTPEYCRASYRSDGSPDDRYDGVGFRVVLVPSSKTP